MKLEQLMQREQFPAIFKATLTKFFSSSGYWEGYINWGTHGGNEDINLIANSKLNLIFPVNLPKAQLIPLVAEYAYHKNPLRRLLQKIYISFALDPIFRKFFSPIKLHITNKSNLPNNICILPGNHSIRIIDLDLDQCLVLTKDGFDNRKLMNSVSIRSAYPDLPGPKIIDSNFKEGWYTEERITGLPIDRVNNPKSVNKSIATSKDFLSRLYESTMRSESSHNFLENKFYEVDKTISSLPECFRKLDLEDIRFSKSLLVKISASLFKENDRVLISQTHGDLQDANLLVPSHDSNRDVYIIDWEYSNERCAHYDWFVFGLKSRSPKGLSARINFLLNADHALRSELNWYDFSKSNSSEVKTLVILFIIEEFLFRLEDVSLPNLSEIPHGFSTFLKEVKKISRFDFS